MADISLSQIFLKALEDEAPATRKCLEKIPGDLFNWKPHERSLTMGYLALMVAEFPRWVATMAKESELDFATFQHPDLKTAADLTAYFDKNMQEVRVALRGMPNEAFSQMFDLKANGKIVTTFSKRDNIESIIRHWIHHRGQLSVYLRLNDIPVPALYGPSADDRGGF